jgi:DNA-binding Lrp family transcriptional regulator
MGKVYTYSGLLPKQSEVFRMQDIKPMDVVPHLRQNGRIKLTELSRKSGIPVSTLFDRMHKLEQFGIRRVTALLDFDALGFHVRATLLLKAGIGKRDELLAFLKNSPSVNNLSRINNGHDCIAECVFRDLRELEEFCERIERRFGVKKRDAHLTIEELKREGFLAWPQEVKNGSR